MPHPKPNEVYAADTVVRIKKTGEFARIIAPVYLMDKAFLHYHAEIEGREPGSMWALYHDDIEFEAPPMDQNNFNTGTS